MREKKGKRKKTNKKEKEIFECIKLKMRQGRA